MRKLIIIGLLALAVWLVAMPGLVGLYLREAVPAWLQESQRSADIQYAPDWFTSRAVYRPDSSIDLALTARHFPPLKPGWVALDGKLASPFTPQQADIWAHLGLTGSWHLSASAETFRANPHSELTARDLTLNVAQIPNQPASMTVTAAELQLPNQSKPLLDLRVRGLKNQVDNKAVRLGLDMQARDALLGGVQLVLQAGPLLPEHLETLTETLNQLAASDSDSVSENLALLSLASVWQQMASHGLTIELETLRFGDEASFQGVWVTARPGPSISGSGDIQALAGWINRLLGDQANDPELGPIEMGRLLAQFGETEIEGSRFVFSAPARPGPSSRPGLEPSP